MSLYNLARVETATTGTGTITLGAAASGYLTFALAGATDGQTVSYAIEDGANREVGRGVYTASGTTLTRTVLKSTNSDAAISLSGSAEVFITALAEDFSELVATVSDPIPAAADTWQYTRAADSVRVFATTRDLWPTLDLVRDFGADETGVTDARAAWDDAMSVSNYKKLIVPAGVYVSTTGFPVTTKSGLVVQGSGRANTAFRATANTVNVMSVTDGNYVDLLDFALDRSSSSDTAGSGLYVSGASSNVRGMRLRSTDQPVNGYAFIGTSGTPLSECGLAFCEGLENDNAALLTNYCNDYTFLENAWGRVGVENSVYGAYLQNSELGLYGGNRHWGHDVGAVINNCVGTRVNVNRIEESDFQGLIVEGGSNGTIITGNFFHSNGSAGAGSGVYPHIRIVDSTLTKVTNSHAYTWNAGVARTNFFLETSGTCTVSVGINDAEDWTDAKYSFSAGTTVDILDSDKIALVGPGDTTDYIIDLSNPSTASYAGVATTEIVDAVARSRTVTQSIPGASAGQKILQVSDTGGTLQNVVTLLDSGASLHGVPVAPTASPGTNTTQIASTAFVTAGLATKEATNATLTALATLGIGAANRHLSSDGTNMSWSGAPAGWRCSGATIGTVAASTTVYLGHNAQQSAADDTGFNIPAALTLVSCAIAEWPPAGTGETFTYEIYKSGVATGITGTISGASDATLTLTGSLTVAAQDQIAIKLDTSASAAAAKHRYAITWAEV